MAVRYQSDAYPMHGLGSTKPPTAFPQVRGRFEVVGDTGIEPVTSSVSGKRATAAPIALNIMMLCEVRTGFEPAYTALQAAA